MKVSRDDSLILPWSFGMQSCRPGIEFFAIPPVTGGWKSEDLWKIPHAYMRQPDGHTGPTCLIDIATPTGLARVSVTGSRTEDVHRGPPDMCCIVAPFLFETIASYPIHDDKYG